MSSAESIEGLANDGAMNLSMHILDADDRASGLWFRREERFLDRQDGKFLARDNTPVSRIAPLPRIPGPISEDFIDIGRLAQQANSQTSSQELSYLAPVVDPTDTHRDSFESQPR